MNTNTNDLPPYTGRVPSADVQQQMIDDDKKRHPVEYDEQVAEGKYTDELDQKHYWYGYMLTKNTELGDITVAWWAEDQWGEAVWYTKAERDAAIVNRVTHTKK